MERGEPTSEQFAPTDINHLAEMLGGFSCQGCELPRCFEDRHHTIFTGSEQVPLTEVEQLLKSHPDMIVRGICRAKHQDIHKEFGRSQPITDEFGLGYLMASPLNLKANQRKKLKQLWKDRNGTRTN